MDTQVTLGCIDDIPDGDARGFDPAHTGCDTLFVVRKGGRVFGWHDRCPHEGVTPLPYRRHKYLNARGTRIVCFAHGAQFDIESGECLLGPCQGDALSKVPLAVGPAGELSAWLPAANLGGGIA